MNRFCAKTNQFLYFRASESLSLMAIREAHRPTLRGCGGAAPTIRGGVGGAAPHHKGVWGRSPHLSFVFSYRRDSTSWLRNRNRIKMSLSAGFRRQVSPSHVNSRVCELPVPRRIRQRHQGSSCEHGQDPTS